MFGVLDAFIFLSVFFFYHLSISLIVIFFCFCCIFSSLVVSAALLRIFGQKVAELPIVATSREYQGRVRFCTSHVSLLWRIRLLITRDKTNLFNGSLGLLSRAVCLR